MIRNDLNSANELLLCQVGEVSTKFHSVKMRIRTKCHNFDLSPDVKEIVAELTESSQEEDKGQEIMVTSPPDTVITSVTTPKTEAESYDVR